MVKKSKKQLRIWTTLFCCFSIPFHSFAPIAHFFIKCAQFKLAIGISAFCFFAHLLIRRRHFGFHNSIKLAAVKIGLSKILDKALKKSNGKPIVKSKGADYVVSEVQRCDV